MRQDAALLAADLEGMRDRPGELLRGLPEDVRVHLTEAELARLGSAWLQALGKPGFWLDERGLDEAWAWEVMRGRVFGGWAVRQEASEVEVNLGAVEGPWLPVPYVDELISLCELQVRKLKAELGFLGLMLKPQATQGQREAALIALQQATIDPI